MAGTSPEEIRDLILRVEALAVRSAHKRVAEDHTADRVDSLVKTAFVDIPLTHDGEVDIDRWAALDPEDREDRRQTLLRLKDSLEVLTSSDGPDDPHSFMFRDYVSNRGVIALTLFALLGTLTILVSVYLNWSRATEYTKPGTPPSQQTSVAATGSSTVSNGPEEKDVLLMVMLMGSLGGFVHLTSSLTKYIGNRDLVRSWIVYYLLMPLEGAGLSVTVYLMVRVGVLNPAATNAEATKNLNWVGIYALATLAGLFSKQALEMLGDVFSTIFRRVAAKDAGGAGRPSDEPPRR
jgi:hypothetical protein